MEPPLLSKTTDTVYHKFYFYWLYYPPVGDYHREYHARKRAAGLCWECTRKALPKRVRCALHAKRHRRVEQQYRQLKKKAAKAARTQEIVHFSDYASQPDIHIVCDDVWTTPHWGKVKRKLPEMIYLGDDGRCYTFEFDQVTCNKCKLECDPLNQLSLPGQR